MKSANIKYKWLFFWYVMVCLSGLYEVQLHFNKRNLFQEYQTIVSETQKIEMEWRELQLDYSALTSGQKIGLTFCKNRRNMAKAVNHLSPFFIQFDEIGSPAKDILGRTGRKSQLAADLHQIIDFRSFDFPVRSNNHCQVIEKMPGIHAVGIQVFHRSHLPFFGLLTINKPIINIIIGKRISDFINKPSFHFLISLSSSNRILNFSLSISSL